MVKAKTPVGKDLVLRPDSKGRINLGNLADGVSGFSVTADSEGTITLIPRVEIPAREAWIWRTPSVLQAIKTGMQQSRDGQVTEQDFSQFADLPVDDEAAVST